MQANANLEGLQVNDSVDLKEALMEKVDNLSLRDVVVIIGVGVAILFAILFFVFRSVNSSIDRSMKESTEYRKALLYVAENREEYQKNTKQKEEVRQMLLAADSKIDSKITALASNLDLDFQSNTHDAKKIDEESGAEETEIELTFKNVDYKKFIEYLVEVHKLEAPIYLHYMKIERNGNSNNPDTKVTVTLKFMSYRLKEQNAA